MKFESGKKKTAGMRKYKCGIIGTTRRTTEKMIIGILLIILILSFVSVFL
jgi:hypothetical protein